MYRIVQGNTHNLPDVQAFLQSLNSLSEHPDPEVRDLFQPERDLTVARAPGRLDLMGGIADYSGSLVLQLPIGEATLVAAQRDPARSLKVISLAAGGGAGARKFAMPLAALEEGGKPVGYEAARAYFRGDPDRHWAAYVAGVFLVLMRERGMSFAEGARLLIASHVPEGKGLSSSAAIEVATMQAVAAAFGVVIDPVEQALLCQQVENLVVGAPCGVMDQMTSACGEQDRLLALLCQPARLLGTVPLPAGVVVWGVDSGVRHSVSGADYGAVRVGAFMGYRMIADLAGLPVSGGPPGTPLHIEDAKWRGHLANLSPSEFEQYGARLPERIAGAEFLARYGGTTDQVTRVESGRTYAVRAPTAHPVYEHFRVQAFAELLQGKPTDGRLALLGELMYQSHASYSACGLGSDGTDRLVELVRAGGPQRGLYGAKITGGGSGGTVAVLGRPEGQAALSGIAEEYAHQRGYRPYVVSGSSPGAAAFGCLRLKAGGEP